MLLDKVSNTKFGWNVKNLISKLQFIILARYSRFEPEVVHFLKSIYREEQGPVLFSPDELYLIYSIARAKKNQPGDYAEVGVFRGASAKAICEAKGEDKSLYLFDTFEGLQDVSDKDNLFKNKMFTSDEDKVRKRLSSYKNWFIYKGYFPETADSIDDKKFSLVHLDVDTYQSTKACLEFFYPRMNDGGIILSHDYGQAKGVWDAFKESEFAKLDTIIPLGSSQVMVIKGVEDAGHK